MKEKQILTTGRVAWGNCHPWRGSTWGQSKCGRESGQGWPPPPPNIPQRSRDCLLRSWIPHIQHSLAFSWWKLSRWVFKPPNILFKGQYFFLSHPACRKQLMIKPIIIASCYSWETTTCSTPSDETQWWWYKVIEETVLSRPVHRPDGTEKEAGVLKQVLPFIVVSLIYILYFFQFFIFIDWKHGIKPKEGVK